MSESGVYRDDMLRTRMSDNDVERLLCGESPKDEALESLAPILSAFDNVSWPAPSEEAVARFASEAAEIAQAAQPDAETIPARSGGASRWMRPVLQRWLATGLATLLLVSGLSAVAVAFDDAIPGDQLYGLDRAFEAVGIGDGGPAERISEARALFELGQVAEAIEHAAEAVEATAEDGDGTDGFSPESVNAREALQAAADNVQTGNDDPQSQEVRDAVAAMLSEMAAMIEDPALEGKNFGQKVAEMATMLGGNDTATSDQEQPPNSDSSPGPPDNPGPPEDPPGNAGDGTGGTDGSTGQSGQTPVDPPGRP